MLPDKLKMLLKWKKTGVVGVQSNARMTIDRANFVFSDRDYS